MNQIETDAKWCMETDGYLSPVDRAKFFVNHYFSQYVKNDELKGWYLEMAEHWQKVVFELEKNAENFVTPSITLKRTS